MIDKTFENKENGQEVVIKNDDGVWFTLNNGSKIKKDTFFSKYTEKIDPTSFFNNQNNIQGLAEKIKNVDTSNVSNTPTEPDVKRLDDNKHENNMANDIDQKQKLINDFVEKQKKKEEELSKYKQLNDEQAAEQLIENKYPQTSVSDKKDNQPFENNPNYPEFDPKIKKDRDNKNISQEQPNTIEDESYKFFRGFKKNHKIVIELKFDEYIADPEFLKLMMNNFESDIIKFYTKEIYKNITSDPQKIEDEIYNQLEKIISGKKKTTTRRKRKPVAKKTTTTTSNEKEQINDVSEKPLELIKKDDKKNEENE